MRTMLQYIPEPLLWGLAVQGLLLVLLALACAFVWLAMDTD